MSGYEKSRSATSGATPAHRPHPPAPSRDAYAHHAVSSLAARTQDLGAAIEAARTARLSHQRADWARACERVERAIVRAEQCLQHARAVSVDAPLETKQQLDRVAEVLAGHVEAAGIERGQPAPTGFARITRETELLALLEAPVEGNAEAGFANRQKELEAEFDRLSASERRVLRGRLTSNLATDPIARAFTSRLSGARRSRLLAYLSARPAAIEASAPRPLSASLRGELEAATGTSLAHVNIHTGADGRAVTEAHGARAVARGSDVYMGEGQFDEATAEGRELIAHEIAHVVQAQTPQVHAALPLGTDPVAAAEAEADEFAAGFRERGAGHSWRPTVGVAAGVPMRAPRDAHKQSPSPKPDVAFAYLRANQDKFIAAIEKRLASVVPPVHERLAWTQGGIAKRFGAALEAALAGEALFLALPQLLHPTDPWYLIDQNRSLVEGTAGVVIDGREPRGVLTWNPQAGEMVALEVVTRLRESLLRMTPRFVVQLDVKRPDPVVVADLVTSHPMDRVTANLLVDTAVVAPAAKMTTTKPGPAPEPALFRDGIRFLADWRWLGEQDPDLWNWIEVKSPRDATAEDVAATLLHRDGAPPSHQAYGITAAAPFFRLEPSWARMFAEAKAHAPGGPDKPHSDHGLALAESALATDAALAQAADERKFDRRGIPLAPDLARLSDVLEQSHRQLERVKQELVPWKLWELVVPAAAWVAKHRQHLLAIPSGRLVGLTPVFEGQQTILFEAVGAVQDVITVAGRSSGSERDTGPITNVLRHYATAIGESHLVDTARTQLAKARQAKATLTLDLLDRSLRESHDAARELKANESRMQWGGAVSASDQLADDHHQLVELHAKQAAGETIAEDDVALLAARLKEHAFETRAKSLYLQLYNLREEARDASQGFVPTLALLLEGVDLSHASKAKVEELAQQMRFLDVAPKMTALMDELRAGVIDAVPARKQERLRTAVGRGKDVQAWASNEAVRYAEQQLGEFVARNKLGELVRQAVSKIEDQRIQTLVVQIGILIGIGVVGGIAGSIVGGAVRGTLLADTAVASVGMMRGAQALGTIASIATDATVNAVGQVLVMGGSGKTAFVDNLLSNAAVRVALSPLQRAAAGWGAVDLALENAGRWERLGQRVTRSFATGGMLTAEMLTGGAVAYAVQRARKSGPVDDETAASWALQGASMVVGRFISVRLMGIEKRLAQMAEHGAHLRMKAISLRALAKRVDATGDKDAAMQLLVEHRKLLVEEAAVIDTLRVGGKLTPQTIATLATGNRFEREGIKGIAAAAMPLRLAGLRPDDASAKVWSGTTEEIAEALHQASLIGLKVETRDHDAGARQWRVGLDGQEIVIIETRLRGRPRPSKANPSDADRKHAQRYAAAAEFMQAQWEAMVKTEIDSRKVVEVDRLVVGYSIAGIIHQATTPEGVGNQLIVYQHKGTLVGRGAQELGQSPKTWDAVGIRSSEQAPRDSAWLTSEQHAHALDIGRLETQVPAYRGLAVDLEVRPKPAGADWHAPHRAFRVKVRDPGGKERWIYADEHYIAGGLGPGDLSQVKKIVDAEQLYPMLARGQLLRGEDPDYAQKAKTGNILVIGPTTTGAWAAEFAAAAGAKVDVMGDTRTSRADWGEITAEYSALMANVASLPAGSVPPHVRQRLDVLESRIVSAHRGLAVPRNRKQGAVYENGIAGKPGTSIEFGTPSRIQPNADGTVLVTVGRGADATTKVYDQVVIAHGQDPGEPSGPGALLGRGAASEGIDPTTGARRYGEVPKGTIRLEPHWGPVDPVTGERDLLGLQSIDPPGIHLIGASYATKRMSPYVDKRQRADFERGIDRMAPAGAATRDHGPISEHSTRVEPGIEVQRDRIPRANEAREGPRFRLPGKGMFELDADRSKWDAQVREWFALNLRADHAWVRVQRLGGGRSGAVIYRVSVGDNDVGIFKIFDTAHGAKQEQEMLQLLAKAKLTRMKAVGERGRMATDPKAKTGEALLMDVAKGTSIRELIEQMPHEPELRVKALTQLEFAMKRAAEGLAEMHAKFGSRSQSGAPTLMSREAKLDDANYMLNENFRGGSRVERVKAVLGTDFERVKAMLEGPVLQGFLDADVPATAYHGDANAGNFIVHEYKKDVGFKDLGVIDVGSMQWSVRGAKGMKTGAADVARLLESLETVQPGALTDFEVMQLRREFNGAYRAHFRGFAGYVLDAAAYAHAEKWYRVEFEISVLKSDPTAKKRLLKILGMEKSHE